jgi:thiol-disulfide isomerase/thioredoxin
VAVNCQAAATFEASPSISSPNDDVPTTVAPEVPESRLLVEQIGIESAPAIPVPLETAPLSPAVAAPVYPITTLDHDTFNAFVMSGNDLVIVDFYTDWCGPCKIMHKELDKLTTIFKRVRFARLNCGTCDQAFASKQRIKGLPTFRLYRRGRLLEEITGARPVELRQLLNYHARPWA